MKTVLKDDTVTAFTECQSFDNHIKAKQKEFDEFLNECTAKYPNHAGYLNSFKSITDLKSANSELCILKDAIECLNKRMELMTDNVQENENLLGVLRSALTLL